MWGTPSARGVAQRDVFRTTAQLKYHWHPFRRQELVFLPWVTKCSVPQGGAPARAADGAASAASPQSRAQDAEVPLLRSTGCPERRAGVPVLQLGTRQRGRQPQRDSTAREGP